MGVWVDVRVVVPVSENVGEIVILGVADDVSVGVAVQVAVRVSVCVGVAVPAARACYPDHSPPTQQEAFYTQITTRRRTPVVFGAQPRSRILHYTPRQVLTLAGRPTWDSGRGSWVGSRMTQLSSMCRARNIGDCMPHTEDLTTRDGGEGHGSGSHYKRRGALQVFNVFSQWASKLPVAVCNLINLFATYGTWGSSQERSTVVIR